MGKHMDMNLATKSYQLSPYDFVSRQECSWIPTMREFVSKRIDWLSNLMRKEAEADGQPELADEKFLYERFEDNRDSGMQIGNWQIFKYFIRVMEIKILYEMLGEWRYTSSDLYMYSYFRSCPSTCKRKYINFTVADDDTIEMFMNSYHVRYASIFPECRFFASHDKSGYKFDVPYFVMFEKRFIMLNDMVKHCLNCKESEYSLEEFFTSDDPYNWHDIKLHTMFKYTFDEQSTKDERWLSDKNRAIVESFIKFCNADDKYKEHQKKLMKIVEKKFEEFRMYNSVVMSRNTESENISIKTFAKIFTAGQEYK